MGITTKDLGSLASLYRLGVLDEQTPMMLDNDDASVYDDNGNKVFEMDPHDLLREALKLFSIPYVEV